MLNKKQTEENIISLLGLQALPDAQKLAMLDKMSDLAQKRITARVLELLSDEDKQAFIDSASDENGTQAMEILKNKNIDLSAITREEIIGLKEDMKKVVDALKI